MSLHYLQIKKWMSQPKSFVAPTIASCPANPAPIAPVERKNFSIQLRVFPNWRLAKLSLVVVTVILVMHSVVRDAPILESQHLKPETKFPSRMLTLVNKRRHKWLNKLNCKIINQLRSYLSCDETDYRSRQRFEKVFSENNLFFENTKIKSTQTFFYSEALSNWFYSKGKKGKVRFFVEKNALYARAIKGTEKAWSEYAAKHSISM